MKEFFSFVRRRKGKKNTPLSSVVDNSSPFGSVGFGQHFLYDGHDQQSITLSPFSSSRYRYALNEYLQTVEPLDGINESSVCSYDRDIKESTRDIRQNEAVVPKHPTIPLPQSSCAPGTNSNQAHFGSGRGNIEAVPSVEGCDLGTPLNEASIDASTSVAFNAAAPPPPPPLLRPNRLLASAVVPPIPFGSPMVRSPDITDAQETISDCYFYDGGDGTYQGKLQRQPNNEPNMPDTTYEESYGDAYIGGPIRYIYPSGYHSLRPRSGPWKLSLLVFVTFSWLSVFIVGYCADMVDLSISYDTSIDDYSRKLETQWCGSTSVRMMWILSISITGIAAAYCSIIGYVQGRDFVVANSRSQPPGMSGKSDYYIKIDDMKKASGYPKNATNYSQQSYQTGQGQSIYQADGTPQFWGDYIYRPTQAAVAVTSR